MDLSEPLAVLKAFIRTSVVHSLRHPHHLYLLTIVDDFSRRIFGFLAKSQSEWMDIWSKFVVQIEAEVGKPNCISWLLTDNGAVYKSATMVSFCAARGIQQRFSAPYAQWMNTAERNMRTIGEMTITTMIHANLPKNTWGYAILHAVDVLNRTADSVSDKNNWSRLERWKGHALPNQTKGLYPFGCPFKHVPPALRTKLDAHATPVVYLGIDPKSRSYRLGSLYALHLSVSVDVTFLENVFPFRLSRMNLVLPHCCGELSAALLKEIRSLACSTTMTRLASPRPLTCPHSKLSALFQNLRAAKYNHSRKQTMSRARGPSLSKQSGLCHLWKLCGDDDADESMFIVLTETSLQTITPRNGHQAVHSTRSAHWIAAMNREKQCHIKNGTFGEEWKDGNGAVKPIPADWVYKVKYRGPPIDEKYLQANQYKARVVIRGQFMKEGLDFNDTFAPVAKPVTLRALLAVATKHGCLIKSGDVETAFLTAPIDCEIWVKMPPYWGSDAEPLTGVIAERPPRRLLKGVPGIPQGSRLFFETFSAQLLQMGFQPSKADCCLFLKPGNEFTAVVVWVDDFVFVHEKEATWQDFIGQLRQRFTVPTAGPLTSFLGMEIAYDPKLRTMFISQASTIEVLLERARMTDCNPVPVPCSSGAVFSKKDCPSPPSARATEYASLVALVNFLACWTRPDVVFIVNKLCKFMSNPGDVCRNSSFATSKAPSRRACSTSSMGLTRQSLMVFTLF